MTAKKTAPDPLIIAISNRLCKMDASSREKRAQEIAARMFPEEFVAKEAKPSAIGADLGIDPGENAKGKIGAFWDNDHTAICIGVCTGYNGDKIYSYTDTNDATWKHFRHIPTASSAQKFIDDSIL